MYRIISFLVLTIIYSSLSAAQIYHLQGNIIEISSCQNNYLNEQTAMVKDFIENQTDFVKLNNSQSTKACSCGLSGSLQERIADCAAYNTHSNSEFVLVYRDQELNELYLEKSHQVLWSRPLKKSATQKAAAYACLWSFGDVAQSLKFNLKLPAPEDFERVRNKKLYNVINNMNRLFWTSEVVGPHGQNAIQFHGVKGYGNGSAYSRSLRSSVMCMGKLKF